MVTTLPSSIPPLSVSSSKDPRHIPDTEEIAGYLLTLKHRSVTPDPHSSDRAQQQQVVSGGSQTSVYHHHHTTSQQQPESPFVEQPSNSNNSHEEAVVDESRVGPTGELSHMPWEQLIADSKLVSMQDRDLVPDCLFVAMAQMKPCRLQPADRVGCYKSREIGFIGMCCKHCGGQPGFGRFFPNSVRSLAQTTTSQTILKHIGTKCQFCPTEIRDSILELQRHQAIREGFPTGRPRYGSRKIFFQRIWERLHGEDTIKAMDAEAAADIDNNNNNIINKPLQQVKPRPTAVAAAAAAAPKTMIPTSDTSVGSFESSSSSDDEVARANAHVVQTKRTREYAAPEYYFPKRPKFTNHQQQWTTTAPHHHQQHPHQHHHHAAALHHHPAPHHHYHHP